MTFAERLSELMQDNGITKYRLSKLAGCSATTVANWLSGKDVTPVYLQKLSEIFSVSTDYLLNGTKKAPTQEGERELPYSGYREVLQESGIRILLDADAKVTQDDLDDIVEFIKFKQRKNGR